MVYTTYVYENHEFLFGSVALWSMSLWALTEDEVKQAIRDPDSYRKEDESGIIKILTAQTRDFSIGAHFVEKDAKTILIRYAFGQYDN